MPGHPGQPDTKPEPIVPQTQNEQDTTEQGKQKELEKKVPEKNDDNVEEKFHHL